ncbi:phage tail protein [Streptomyces sp. SID8380]|nr:phage tail protein [Streptomyces sp. SID8380]
MARKITAPVGLQNIHYALLLKDDEAGVEYGTPKKLAPAITATVTPTMNSATLHGDDGPVLTANALDVITVEIGVVDLSFEDQAELLGATLAANGLLIDNANDQAPEVAIGWQRTMDDGSSRFTWLLKGKFQLPTEEATTKQGEPNFQTPTITGTFLKRQFDGEWRFRADGSNPDSAALVAAWFDAVPVDPKP